MIEIVFEREYLVRRQREAPLLQEREQYLSHLLKQGTSKKQVRKVAIMLLHIVRVMEMSSRRTVDVAQIEQAGLIWSSGPRLYKGRRGGATSAGDFRYFASKWLRFHNLIAIPEQASTSSIAILEEFRRFLKVDQGMSEASIQGYMSKTSLFLRWATPRHDLISSVSLKDVDNYLDERRSAGLRPKSISGTCGALKAFFRFSEIRGGHG
jgi:hypothetical protein